MPDRNRLSCCIRRKLDQYKFALSPYGCEVLEQIVMTSAVNGCRCIVAGIILKDWGRVGVIHTLGVYGRLRHASIVENSDQFRKSREKYDSQPHEKLSWRMF